jgi:hypothetical protein
MSLSLRSLGILIAAATTAAAFVVAAGVPADAAAAGHDRSYLVTVENLTETQLLTPAVVATHRGNAVFRAGTEASAGIQGLAENGDVPGLVAELEAADTVSAVAVAGDAPIAPGGSVQTVVTAAPGAWRLSAAAMLICTNDGFGGATKIKLPSRHGEVRAVYGLAYDAGTEVNTERYEDLVPPCDGLGTAGTSNPALTEDDRIRPHKGISGVGDLTMEDHGWTGPVVKISVERVDVYDISVENLTAGQPQTPFVFATHRFSASVFEKGASATAGVQGVAENGDVPGLVAELTGAHGIGTVAVVGAAPILPGESAAAQVIVRGGNARASLVGMLVCTNDGFAGVDTVRLPEAGSSATFYGKSYDAGTEINTEAYADLVPPCDGLGQAGTSNPALAEKGVVSHHAGIIGGADLDPAVHGWSDPVVKVTITAVGR